MGSNRKVEVTFRFLWWRGI